MTLMYNAVLCTFQCENVPRRVEAGVKWWVTETILTKKDGVHGTSDIRCHKPFPEPNHIIAVPKLNRYNPEVVHQVNILRLLRVHA